jgi:hypothetical protein
MIDRARFFNAALTSPALMNYGRAPMTVSTLTEEPWKVMGAPAKTRTAGQNRLRSQVGRV